LNAINNLPQHTAPWNLSFSYGRALQTTVLQKWLGDFDNNTIAAQTALKARGAECSQGALGTYKGGEGSTADDFVPDYTY
jgi:fructose-bisphosphate aldolase class I